VRTSHPTSAPLPGSRTKGPRRSAPSNRRQKPSRKNSRALAKPFDERRDSARPATSEPTTSSVVHALLRSRATGRVKRSYGAKRACFRRTEIRGRAANALFLALTKRVTRRLGRGRDTLRSSRARHRRKAPGLGPDGATARAKIVGLRPRKRAPRIRRLDGLQKLLPPDPLRWTRGASSPTNDAHQPPSAGSVAIFARRRENANGRTSRELGGSSPLLPLCRARRLAPVPISPTRAPARTGPEQPYNTQSKLFAFEHIAVVHIDGDYNRPGPSNCARARPTPLGLAIPLCSTVLAPIAIPAPLALPGGKPTAAKGHGSSDFRRQTPRTSRSRRAVRRGPGRGQNPIVPASDACHRLLPREKRSGHADGDEVQTVGAAWKPARQPTPAERRPACPAKFCKQRRLLCDTASCRSSQVRKKSRSGVHARLAQPPVQPPGQARSTRFFPNPRATGFYN